MHVLAWTFATFFVVPIQEVKHGVLRSTVYQLRNEDGVRQVSWRGSRCATAHIENRVGWTQWGHELREYSI